MPYRSASWTDNSTQASGAARCNDRDRPVLVWVWNW